MLPGRPVKDEVARDAAQGATPVGEILDAWRAQGADRIAPVRFHYIAALHRRAAGHHGEARRILEGRLSELIGAYADDVEAAPAGTGDAEGAMTPAVAAPVPAPERKRSAIGGLLDELANRAAAPGNASADPTASGAFPEPGTLAELRRIWSGLRARSQLRQSLERAPANAGPLNSRLLVHRALTLMRDTSPEYAERFLAYLDTLSWLERMGDGVPSADRQAPGSTGGRKRARARPRRRG